MKNILKTKIIIWRVSFVTSYQFKIDDLPLNISEYVSVRKRRNTYQKLSSAEKVPTVRTLTVSLVAPYTKEGNETVSIFGIFEVVRS